MSAVEELELMRKIIEKLEERQKQNEKVQQEQKQKFSPRGKNNDGH